MQEGRVGSRGGEPLFQGVAVCLVLCLRPVVPWSCGGPWSSGGCGPPEAVILRRLWFRVMWSLVFSSLVLWSLGPLWSHAFWRLHDSKSEESLMPCMSRLHDSRSDESLTFPDFTIPKATTVWNVPTPRLQQWPESQVRNRILPPEQHRSQRDQHRPGSYDASQTRKLLAAFKN